MKIGRLVLGFVVMAAMTAIVVVTLVCQLSGRRSSGERRMRDTTGSPMAPRARLESVTPSAGGPV